MFTVDYVQGLQRKVAELKTEVEQHHAKLAVVLFGLERISQMTETWRKDAEHPSGAPYLAKALIASLPAQAKLYRDVVEAAKDFRENGTVLTSCSRGPCQQVVEHEDNSDPQAKLYAALARLAATDRSEDR